MTPFRLLQLSIIIVLLFGSTWTVRVLGLAAAEPGSSPTWLGSTPALAGVLQQNDNGDNNDGAGDNGDNGDDNGNEDSSNNNNNNSSSNNNNNSEDSGDENENFDNDNFDDFDFGMPPAPGPSREPEPTCSTSGKDTVFTSYDRKVTVRVFGTSPRPIRVEILQVIDFLSAPLPPGNLVGLLAYEIRASYCDTNPIAQLPAEVNLAIKYNDIEATGLDESRFVIGRLDTGSRTWQPVEKRNTDTANNVTTATIGETGFYMVWEAR